MGYCAKKKKTVKMRKPKNKVSTESNCKARMTSFPITLQTHNTAEVFVLLSYFFNDELPALITVTKSTSSKATESRNATKMPWQNGDAEPLSCHGAAPAAQEEESSLGTLW